MEWVTAMIALATRIRPIAVEHHVAFINLARSNVGIGAMEPPTEALLRQGLLLYTNDMGRIEFVVRQTAAKIEAARRTGQGEAIMRRMGWTADELMGHLARIVWQSLMWTAIGIAYRSGRKMTDREVRLDDQGLLRKLYADVAGTTHGQLLLAYAEAAESELAKAGVPNGPEASAAGGDPEGWSCLLCLFEADWEQLHCPHCRQPRPQRTWQCPKCQADHSTAERVCACGQRLAVRVATEPR